MGLLISSIDVDQYEIVALTRNPSNLNIPQVKVVEGDLNEDGQIELALSGCEMIIHAAAITHSFDPRPYYKVNFEGTKRLVLAAKKQKVKNFIFISSHTAGEHSGAYGKSKLLAERFIQENLSDWLLFRPAEIFGSTKKEGIENLIDDAVKKKTMLCPTGVPSKLYPIHIDDTDKIMYDFIFNKKTSNKIITINGDQGFSYKELIKMVGKVAGKKTLIIPVPRLAMFFIKWILETFKIKIGLVPDQIPRLYSRKAEQHLGYPLVTIEGYVSKRLTFNSG